MQSISSVDALRGQLAMGDVERPAEVADGADFASALEDAVQSTDQTLRAGDQAAMAMAAGEDVGLHETMIAVEKADIAFRTLTAVKNRALEAYNEVMRMQI